MKALILAAGFGTRLKPLTLDVAKPSVWFFDRPVISYCLDHLARAGVTRVVINLHHRAWSIRRHLRNLLPADIDTRFSFEPVILGTAGALNPVRQLLQDDSIIIINGDVLADIDISDVISFHQKQKRIATMVLHPASLTGGYPAVGADDDSNVIRFPYGVTSNCRYTWAGTFTGIQIVEPDIVEYLPETGYASIVDSFYLKALDRGERVGGYRHSGYWSDIGTPHSYFTAHVDVLEERFRPVSLNMSCERVDCHGVYIHRDAVVGLGARITGTSVVSRRARVGPGAGLFNTIVWPQVRIPADAEIRNSIVYGVNKILHIPELEQHHGVTD